MKSEVCQGVRQRNILPSVSIAGHGTSDRTMSQNINPKAPRMSEKETFDLSEVKNSNYQLKSVEVYTYK